mgnify:CR=1 FL=1|tara:strand:- start:7166 stop:7633 length:468 start_codon:yes stop_codon:yes gene_type:complete
MILQTVNRSDAEKVWVNVTNVDGQTITTHYPVFLMASSKNIASVGTNEVASRANSCLTGEGSFVGLAFEDIPNNDVGQVQIYGYHESALIYRIVGSVEVAPGHPLGPGAAASVGLGSTGATQGLLGPVVALDTVTATMHSLGTINYTNHVFLRAM